jgi:hypothetical protein
MSEKEYITLKWGTLKSWNITSKEGKKLLKKYIKIGVCMSCACQNDTVEQKKIICSLIDLVPGKIYLHWDGIYVSKAKAKKYVMNYGNLKTQGVGK